MAKVPPAKTPNYAFLQQVEHVPTRQALKVVLDRLNALEAAAVPAAVASTTPPVTIADVQRLVNTGISLRNAAAAVPKPPAVPPNGGPSTPSSSAPTPTTPSGLICYTTIASGQPAGIPAAPNLRWFRGDFCGVEVPGLPAVSGGAANASTVFSPFIDRYSASDRAKIYAAYHARNYTHYPLSWPDSRSGNGQTIAQYVATCVEVQGNGLYPCSFLSSKDWDTADVPAIMAGLVPLLAAMQAAGVIPIACVGWELSIWLSPTQVQDLIDQIAAIVVPGTNLYVHFQEDYISFQQPGHVTADFWTPNVGKLTGLWHQKALVQDCGLYQARIADGTIRFAGNLGFPADSGFGHPFDYVAFEYSASPRFAGGMSESDAMQIGLQAICAPGSIPVMGYANGGPNV